MPSQRLKTGGVITAEAAYRTPASRLSKGIRSPSCSRLKARWRSSSVRIGLILIDGLHVDSVVQRAGFHDLSDRLTQAPAGAFGAGGQRRLG